VNDTEAGRFDTTDTSGTDNYTTTPLKVPMTMRKSVTSLSMMRTCKPERSTTERVSELQSIVGDIGYHTLRHPSTRAFDTLLFLIVAGPFLSLIPFTTQSLRFTVR
jgi:hypothetical protein